MDTSTFTGPVRRRDLGRIDALDGTGLVVAFEAGVRNFWHRHPGGQVLYVLDGVARVGTRDGQIAELGAGDLVEAPPDEEHWHGASEDGPMSHLALSSGETVWLEPVSDD
jgi:quercetin dioxygenase-like cupin family protein